MSPDNTTTEDAKDEQVFADLERELKRLTSAVSHLTLSEKAATTAIEAAERVLQQQSVFGKQLEDYVAKLPQPDQTTATAAQLQELAVSTGQQSKQLEEIQRLIRTEPAPPLLNDSPGYEQLLALTTTLAEHQASLTKTVEMAGQEVQNGVAQNTSQQLAGFLNSALEPFLPVAEMQPTLVRNEQLLQEIHQLVKGLNINPTQDYQAITESVQVLNSSLSPRLEQLVSQASKVQQTLEAIKAQLSKPALAEQRAVTLEQMVMGLNRSAVAQQEAQKRQNTLTLFTLVFSLVTLIGLAVHFLRG